MNERPILFSGPMVRAILDGSKTMTRRVVKPNSVRFGNLDMVTLQTWPKGKSNEDAPDLNGKLNRPDFELLSKNSKYGLPGDRLWVRETWREMGSIQLSDGTIPKAEQLNADNRHVVYAATDPTEGPFRPSIHMPRWASRITLEITGVKVERVQDISEDDAKAEGVTLHYDDPNRADRRLPKYAEAFHTLWNSINTKRGFGWDANPWVWAITFRRVS